jgi:cell surface protein SprA
VNDSPREFGSFSVSTINWATTFSNDDETLREQQLPGPAGWAPGDQRSLGPRRIRIAVNPRTALYWSGYGSTSQDVIIPAFLAAYTGRNASTVKLDPFKLIPLPNWDITYDGLTKLDLFKKLFRTFTVKHSYRSTFSIGGYQTNLLYEPGGNVLDAGATSCRSGRSQWSPLPR